MTVTAKACRWQNHFKPEDENVCLHPGSERGWYGLCAKHSPYKAFPLFAEATVNIPWDSSAPLYTIVPNVNGGLTAPLIPEQRFCQ